jgi:hypothetical protein
LNPRSGGGEPINLPPGSGGKAFHFLMKIAVTSQNQKRKTKLESKKTEKQTGTRIDNKN